jgi:hypothetical protein
MGGTVFHHPQSYIAIARQIRGELDSAARLDSVKLGILLNHAYLPGVINRGPDASGPLAAPVASKFAAYSGGWGPVLPASEWPSAATLQAALPAVKELLSREIDFMVRAAVGLVSLGLASLHFTSCPLYTV